ncbi:MAG: hypothetical protein ACFFCS_23055 [Candidatus Hodarchaeota archaeon]
MGKKTSNSNSKKSDEAIEKEKKELEEYRELLKEKITNILKKGKVVSRRCLSYLLIKAGIKKYHLRFLPEQNILYGEVPELGGVLKKMRFGNKVKFSIENGSHVYYTENTKKTYKVKFHEVDLEWEEYEIPKGENEIYLFTKIPTPDLNYEHFLASCDPPATFEGFKLVVTKDYKESLSFKIQKKGGSLSGHFEDDKIVLKCMTSDKDPDKSVYAMVQVARRIVKELLMMNFRYSEILKITNRDNLMFLPMVPIFWAKDDKAFFKTQYNSILQFWKYNYGQKEGKTYIGENSILSLEKDEEKFNIKDFYPFIEENFKIQVKELISVAIRQDWIINPAKASSYMGPDDELLNLIKAYKEDINVDKIINRRLADKMEKNVFIKETLSNLLLTMLGLSFLTQDNPTLQITIVAFLVAINLIYFYIYRKKQKTKDV